MDIEEMKKSIDEFFDTHSPRDIVETMYRPFIEHMKTFDRAMWEEAIDRELSLGDEQCWYSEDPEVNKFKDLWNIFNTHAPDLASPADLHLYALDVLYLSRCSLSFISTSLALSISMHTSLF